jgi:hypothetical protein
MNQKLQKLLAINDVLAESSKIKETLFNELLDGATDDTIFLRRCRMISQLAGVESQLLKKIYQFDTDDINDYIVGTKNLINELHATASRNA